MESIKKITNLLLALKLLAHQAHLLSSSHADHLLAERIEKDLDDNIDILKEIALYCFDDDSIASSLLYGTGYDFIYYENNVYRKTDAINMGIIMCYAEMIKAVEIFIYPQRTCHISVHTASEMG